MFSGGEANESDTSVPKDTRVVAYEPTEPPKNDTDTPVGDIEVYPVWLEGNGNSWDDE